MAQEMTAATKREVARGGDGETMRSGFVYRPDTDIYETEDHIVLVSDMPGVTPDDVDITLERRVLTVCGRVPAPEHEGYRRVHVEYGEGDFERVFTLSEDIDQERIDATHRNGVLVVKMPKAATARTRKVEVKAA